MASAASDVGKTSDKQGYNSIIAASVLTIAPAGLFTVWFILDIIIYYTVYKKQEAVEQKEVDTAVAELKEAEAEHPLSKPVSNPVSKPASKPVSKPASKPANEPVSKPVSEKKKKKKAAPPPPPQPPAPAPAPSSSQPAASSSGNSFLSSIGGALLSKAKETASDPDKRADFLSGLNDAATALKGLS
jgi:outer membrane biosynthesis protein TonB